MSKKDRQNAIINLINECEIDTQEELTAKLNELGFNTTQATVSRDINELNLIKVNGTAKKFKYQKASIFETPVSDKIIYLFKEIVSSIELANNLIVIITLSGNASSAGMVVDKMNISKILGTIAGDDTLLIITHNNFDAEIVYKRFKEILY